MIVWHVTYPDKKMRLQIGNKSNVILLPEQNSNPEALKLHLTTSRTLYQFVYLDKQKSQDSLTLLTLWRNVVMYSYMQHHHSCLV